MKQVLQNYKTGELKPEGVSAPALKHSRILVKNYYSSVSNRLWKAVIKFLRILPMKFGKNLDNNTGGLK